MQLIKEPKSTESLEVLDMYPSNEDIVHKLNILYATDREEYEKHVKTFKGVGYRIFRNSSGMHKVEYNNSYFQDMFGGAFKDIL